jgi:4-hydroxyphenylacetate 3-monooxygenase
MTRTGDDYLASLRDGREIWIDGERVSDVTAHPAFRNTARTFASLFDMARDPRFRDVLTFRSPVTGDRVQRGYQIPRCYEDLVARRQAIKTWSEATFGFLGRAPDYKASAWAGFAAMPEFFAQAGRQYADNVARHYAYLRDNDVFSAHTIVNPQIDRLAAASEQEEPFLYVGAVRERDDGIVVRGAKMIGTGVAFSDELLVSSIQPFGPDDEAYALSFSIPVATRGLRCISRASYERRSTSVFDYPMASRLDENDALIVFDDVVVPWERVFIYRDIDLSFRQWWDTPSFTYMMAHGATRAWTKLEFLVGIALKIAKANQTYRLAPVRAVLGNMIAAVNVLRGLVIGAEANYERFPGADGVLTPNRAMTTSYLSLGPTLYAQLIADIKTLAGGGLIQLPSSYKDLVTPGVAGDVARYIRSPGVSATERVKLLKLAWDVVGSEFAGRHEQYERFYLGPPYAVQQEVLRTGNPGVCEALVDAALAGYSLEDAIAQADDPLPPVAMPQPNGAIRVGAVEGDGTVASARIDGAPIRRVNPFGR